MVLREVCRCSDTWWERNTLHMTFNHFFGVYKTDTQGKDVVMSFLETMYMKHNIKVTICVCEN